MAERWSCNLIGKRIHLSVEGGCGGTTFGLHCAVDCIQSGGRVLWASPEMPNATRFSQLFASLNIVESSRIEKDHMKAVLDLAKRMNSETTLLLISKSGTDVTGSNEPYRSRSKSEFENNEFEIWGLFEGQRNLLHLDKNGDVDDVRIAESGFVIV